MFRIVLLFSALCLPLLSLPGCSLFAPGPAIAGEVLVRLSADARLNHYRGQPHALVLHIYQLREVDEFRAALSSQHGPGELLNAATAPFHSLAREAMVVQPGQRTEFRITRADGARYMAFVVGYYQYGGSSDYARVYAFQPGGVAGRIWQAPARYRTVIDLDLGPVAIRGAVS